MQIDQGAAATVIVALAAQTVSSIRNSAIMRRMVQEHEKRLNLHDAMMTEFTRFMAYLKAKEGMQL